MRDTYMTSVPTADRLWRNRFCRPFTAVMVVTTATIPITMPSVVSAPRDLLARRERNAMSRDSRATTGNFMPARPQSRAAVASDFSGCFSLLMRIAAPLARSFAIAR
jgi:hypothetical protein